jgi:hypothetical protein
LSASPIGETAFEDRPCAGLLHFAPVPAAKGKALPERAKALPGSDGKAFDGVAA